MNHDLEQDLDRLFERARGAFPEVDASRNFMPELWSRIEQRRPAPWLAWVPAWSARVVAGAAVASLALLLSVFAAHQPASEDLFMKSYLESLTADSMDEHDQAMWNLAATR